MYACIRMTKLMYIIEKAGYFDYYNPQVVPIDLHYHY